MLINWTLGENTVYSERTMGKNVSEHARFFSALKRSSFKLQSKQLCSCGPSVTPVERVGYSLRVAWVS